MGMGEPWASAWAAPWSGRSVGTPASCPPKPGARGHDLELQARMPQHSCPDPRKCRGSPAPTAAHAPCSGIWLVNCPPERSL